jgi:hypothetical protein
MGSAIVFSDVQRRAFGKTVDLLVGSDETTRAKGHTAASR